MSIVSRRRLAQVIVVAAFAAVTPLHAQIPAGTWIRQTPNSPAMTLVVENCCGGGSRLTYHITAGQTNMTLTLESKLDGSEAPVLIDGKATGETMAIKKVDDHHATSEVKMNGKLFGTTTATLSADGKTLTSVGNFNSSVGGNPAGKMTEIWVKK